MISCSNLLSLKYVLPKLRLIISTALFLHHSSAKSKLPTSPFPYESKIVILLSSYDFSMFASITLAQDDPCDNLSLSDITNLISLPTTSIFLYKWTCPQNTPLSIMHTCTLLFTIKITIFFYVSNDTTLFIKISLQY